MSADYTDLHTIYNTNNLDELSNDPSTFCMLPSLPQEMIEFLIKKGPMQPTQSDHRSLILISHFPKINMVEVFNQPGTGKVYLGIFKYEGIGYVILLKMIVHFAYIV